MKAASSQPVDESRMRMYEARLESFQYWPFSGEDKCTPERMAEAGFYACGGRREPDLARCYYCRKELDGWEPDDDPWSEHKSHVKEIGCAYVNLNKKPAEITVKDAVMLEAAKYNSMVKKMVRESRVKFQEEISTVKKGIEKQML